MVLVPAKDMLVKARKEGYAVGHFNINNLEWTKAILAACEEAKSPVILGDDDEQFVLNFLKQEKVLLVHGRGFNWKEPDHFRIVYLPRVEELAQIQEKMTRFLKQYKR